MNSTGSPCVFIVDDDASIRGAIQGLLKTENLRSEAFSTTQEFLRAKRPDGPSCLVLDVNLPGTSGLDFQKELIAAGIEIPIIFITGYGDIPMSVKAMKSGAVEFLTKPFESQELLNAVQQALENDHVLRRNRDQIGGLQERYATLTARERDVMRLVVSGRLNKQIAAELAIRLVTVKVHRSQVMRKMQAQSLAELVRMAEKLLPPPRNTGV